MKKYLIFIVFVGLLNQLHAQTMVNTPDVKYLEDQLYLSLTYNLMGNKPDGISQNGFSGGFSSGFIKDIPFNKDRNFGMGIGFGYGYRALIQNLKISMSGQTIIYDIATDYNSNKLVLQSVELPIEFRWRNSNPTRYKFWRIYGGLKLSYLFLSKAVYRDSLGSVTVKNIPDINKLQYGVILATGYGTWNLHLYYGLNSLFKSGQLNGEDLDMKDIGLGLKFYML